MFNKKNNKIEELRNTISHLKNRAYDAERELVIEKEKKMCTNVYVYLKNNNTITIYDADDYMLLDDFVEISKGEEIVASVKIDDVVAISLNGISINENQHIKNKDFYIDGGIRLLANERGISKIGFL